MNRLKISPTILTGIYVALVAVIAFILRVCFSYSDIFKGDWIKYASADAYYHMRLVDLAAINYPHLQGFDLYNIFPGGVGIAGTSMWVRFMASIASLFGIIDPSPRAIDIVGVFTPPVLAAFTVVIVYFIGKELIGKWGGILSAILLAIIPGEFFSRTKLGFTDYHCFEIFLTSLFILFILLALRAARENKLDLGSLLKRDWTAIRKPAIFSGLAGFTFFIYSLSWSGAPLFIFITFTFILVQFIIDHFRKQNVDYLGITAGITFLLPLILMLFVSSGGIVTFSLLVAFVGSIGITAVSRLMTARKLKPLYFPIALVLLAGAGFGIIYLISPTITSSMVQSFAIFNPQGASLTTIEMQPLISSTYGNAWAVVWNNYNTTFFLAWISLALLVYFTVKKGDYRYTLFLVWSIIILIANLAQRRFGYYYGVNVALLVGYLTWIAVDFARSRIFTERLKQAVAKSKEIRRKALKNKRTTSMTIPYTVMTFVVIVVFFIGYFWSIEPTMDAASRVPYAPSDAWCTVLTWMKDNTPEPFGDPDAYYEHHEKEDYLSYSQILEKYPDETGNPLYYKDLDVYYPYPDSAYGVLSWWDYGYWITRIAHRIPHANPSQNPRAIKDVAEFFISQNETAAVTVTDRLQTGYVIIDYETAYVNPNTGSGKFWAMVTWSDLEVTDYFDVFLVQDSEDTTRYNQRILFFPEYYRSMAVRMYNFSCEAFTPESITVIGYTIQQDQAGNSYKVVQDVKGFTTIEDAEAFMAGQAELEDNTTSYKIIGVDPMESGVPLERLEHFELEYDSPQNLGLNTDNHTGQVRLFKYVE
ncbi:MAG: oligosaccharyl transferase, archaeosortase A system-associated [Dehalococcoidales bacterium]|nr:oligosaccharyl transferase, archaeosortase A system-associated [Dehalococcoidales bacterium]